MTPSMSQMRCVRRQRSLALTLTLGSGLLALFGLLVACGDATRRAGDQYPPDAVVDARVEPDATPLLQIAVGAACMLGEVPCERGDCVHGVCSVICNQTEDCPPDLACVGRGGAGRCTRQCGSAADCDADQICAVTGPDLGFCVASGTQPGGEPCTSREDCASWVCADGLCASACDDAACPADQRCLALHTQSICVPVGDAVDEADCVVGADCASGVCRGGRCSTACAGDACGHDRVCVAYATLDLCERRCGSSADCGSTGICQAGGLCATRGAQADGMPCTDGGVCASGRCQAGQCAAQCEADDCPAARACVTDISGAVCRLAGGTPFGGACGEGAQCASGLCGGGRCTLDCAGAGCPAGTRCTRFADGQFCFSVCHDDDHCADAARCDSSFAEGPICFWRGATPDADACATDDACASGRCHRERCLARCPLGDCPIGTVCTDFGAADLCAPDPRPRGAACGANDVCEPSTTCSGGRCMPTCDAGCPDNAICVGDACRPTCAADADCGPGLTCNRFDGAAPYCDLQGVSAPGDACARASDCRSGLCFDGQCRATCAGACPEGEGCISLAGGAWCLATGDGVIGDPCVDDGVCRSGLCVGRRCASPCPDGGCPDGARCRALRAGGFCVADCDPVAMLGCGLDEACAPYPADDGGLCVPEDEGFVVGAPCLGEADCTAAAIACRRGTDGQRCRAPCAVNADCAAPEICAPMGLDAAYGACLPGGQGGDLAACVHGGECASGWCLAGYLGGRCGRPCDADGGCGDAALCVDLARDPTAPFPVCASVCDAEGCADGLMCRRQIDGTSACY
ncbi:MAG: hypothetical protein ACI9U2_001717 [Bradymonadia bacterium]